jgi:hypothetical protein
MLGIDGVELRRFTQHSCQLGLIRSTDAGVDMLGKAENSMPIIAIPGPLQPSQHQWAAIFTLMVSVFTRCSAGGQCAQHILFMTEVLVFVRSSGALANIAYSFKSTCCCVRACASNLSTSALSVPVVERQCALQIQHCSCASHLTLLVLSRQCMCYRF